MSCSSDYTPEEWRDLVTLAMYVLGSKILEAKNGIFFTRIAGMVKEAISSQSLLVDFEKKYPDNELVISVISCLKPGSSGKSNELKDKLPPLEELVYRVNQILQEKSDEQEASEYRAFIYEFSYEICKSAGGGFLGISENIDAGEADLLHRLKSSLLEGS